MRRALLSIVVALALAGAPTHQAFAEQGYIGIGLEAETRTINGVTFLLVTSVYDRSQFIRGLAPGDMIYEVNSQKFRSYADFQALMGRYQAGDEIGISLLRGTPNQALVRKIRGRLVAAAHMAASTPAAPAQTPAPQTPQQTSSVNWGAVIVTGAIMLAAAAIVKGLAASGSGQSFSEPPSGGRGGGSDYDPYEEERRRNGTSSPSDTSSSPADRPGECFWGYTTMGTCVR